MSWTLIADGLVAVLLIATLVYVRRLSAKLEEMRASRAEFEKLFADFTRTTDQAASHLHHLKATADNTMQDLQARIERAQGLSGEFGRLGDDLKLLTERAEGAADQLDASVGRARFLAAATAPVAATQAAAPAAAAPKQPPLPRDLEDEPALPSGKLSALSGMR
ncbi:MAG: hypothetical protein JNN33_06710 [Rhodospirillaceae bacterium]|nr:hypothetical protein [Rhodospirillaceae bacterium]